MEALVYYRRDLEIHAVNLSISHLSHILLQEFSLAEFFLYF